MLPCALRKPFSPAIHHGSPPARWPARALLCLCVGLAMSGLASDAHAGDAPTALDPIVVTAAPPSTPLVIEIDPKAPRQPVPASDGADLLKTIPGFSLIRKGGSNGDALLRGMAGSRLGLSIDGGQMDGGCPSRMDPATAYVTPALYDSVRVIKGPQSVLHGAGNSAGTVLFEREAPRYTDATFALDGGLLGGSHGRADQSFDLRAGNANGYAGLAFDHTRSGDHADGDGRRVHSSWDRWSADARIGWTPGERTRMELSAGKGDGQAAYAFSGMDGARFLRESVALLLEHAPAHGPFDSIEARLYSNDANHVMDNYTLRSPDPHGMMPMPMASNVARHTRGGRVAAGLDWNGRWHLDAGIDGSTSTHDARSGGLPGSMMGDWRTKPRLRDARMQQLGAFGELTWHLDGQRRVIGGARLDRHRTQGYRFAASGGMGGMDMPGTQAGSRDASLPSGFLRWEQDLDSSTTFNIGIGHAERFPDYWELFGRYADHRVEAFRALAPEKTTQLDVAATHRGERFDTWISAYAGIVRDFIVIDRGNGPMAASQAFNIDARIAGGEAGAKWRISPYWSADASLAFAWGADRTRHRALPQMPPLEARFGVVRDNGQWSLGLLGRVVAAQHRVAVGSGNIVGQDLGPSAGFAVFSLNGGYRFNDRVRLAAGIDNLFDRNYAEHVNASSAELAGYVNTLRVNEPGRIAWAELRFAF